MSTSNSSLPPSPWYMRWSMGVISLALIDWRTSTTVCRCASYDNHALAIKKNNLVPYQAAAVPTRGEGIPFRPWATPFSQGAHPDQTNVR